MVSRGHSLILSTRKKQRALVLAGDFEGAAPHWLNKGHQGVSGEPFLFDCNSSTTAGQKVESAEPLGI